MLLAMGQLTSESLGFPGQEVAGTCLVLILGSSLAQ